MKAKWKHEKLAEDLAQIKGTGYLDVPLGSVWLQDAQRADVIDIKPSYTRFCFTIYEIKVSRGDFLSDIRTEKWKGYLEHCHRFYFAVPSGMVKKEEIPDPAGLIVRGETGWTTIKAAKKLDNEIPLTTLQSLIFNKQKQDSSVRHRNRIYQATKRYTSEEDKLKALKALGKEIHNAMKNKYEYETAKDNYEYLEKIIRKDLAEILEIGSKYPEWELYDILIDLKEYQDKIVSIS